MGLVSGWPNQIQLSVALVVVARLLATGRLSIKATVQIVNLLCQPRHRSFYNKARDDLPDREGTHRRRGSSQLGEPSRQLLGRTREHDAAQSDPSVRGGAHRTVLTRGKNGRRRSFHRGHVCRCPARQLKLRMTRSITGGHTVTIFCKDGSVCGDQYRTKRLIAVLQGLGRQLYTAMQVLHLGIVHHDCILKGMATRTAKVE